MRTDLEYFETLEKQKDRIREAVGVAPPIRLELALDSTHALNELLRGLANLFPHKRSIARLGSLPTPVFEVVKGFAKEGYAVQEIPVNFKNFDEAAALKAFEGLKKDTLFVVASVGAPLTGILYPTGWMRERCAERQMFFIGYAHSAFYENQFFVPENPFEAFVYDPYLKDSTIAFWLGGERHQGEAVLWGKPHFLWRHIEFLEKNLVQAMKASSAADAKRKSKIDAFEKKVLAEIQGAETLSPRGGLGRLYDRAIFSFKGCDGSALVEFLHKKGYEIESAAVCHWGSPHLPQWLLDGGYTPEEVQSSLFIDFQTLDKSSFFVDLSEAVGYLRTISGH